MSHRCEHSHKKRKCNKSVVTMRELLRIQLYSISKSKQEIINIYQIWQKYNLWKQNWPTTNWPLETMVSIKPVKNKSRNHTKFYTGYGVINHSEKHGPFEKKNFWHYVPQNATQKCQKPVFRIFESPDSNKTF